MSSNIKRRIAAALGLTGRAVGGFRENCAAGNENGGGLVIFKQRSATRPVKKATGSNLLNFVTAVGILLPLILPPSVSAQAPNSSFYLRVRSGHFDGATTYQVGSDRLLIGVDVQISLPAAVQLDADLPADSVKGVGATNKTALTAGTILYAADNAQTTFCAKTWSDLNHNHAAPCLTDADSDGRFDHGGLDNIYSFNPPHIVLDDMNGPTLHGARPRNLVVTFPSPIAYHRIDTANLPGSIVNAGIIALSDFDKKKPGPVHFGFAIWQQQSKPGLGSLFTAFHEVTYTGSPVAVDLFGIKLTVVGIDEKGRPLCQLEGQIDDQIQPFVSQNVVEHYSFY